MNCSFAKPPMIRSQYTVIKENEKRIKCEYKFNGSHITHLKVLRETGIRNKIIFIMIVLNVVDLLLGVRVLMSIIAFSYASHM